MADAAPDVQLEIAEDAAWVAAALVLVAALGGAVMLAEWPLWGVGPEEPEEPDLVELAESGTQLWPYTSAAQSYESRTLGINMVFFGDPEMVKRALTLRTELEWEEEMIHEGDAEEETISIERVQFDPEADDVREVLWWDDAEGSIRYTYLEVDGEGRWVDESYQLHAGTYLGNRMHIRAYEDPQGEWTAVQIHDEHWDWFRLRHTVTGISDSQRELERDFMGQRYVDEVVRKPFENETADGDGWATGVYLAGLGIPLFFAVVNRTRRATDEVLAFVDRRRHEIGIGVALFVLYTAVRWLGVVAEGLLPGVSPKVIAAPLYLALVLGTPAIAYGLGRHSEAVWAFAFAALGFGAAFTADFVAMEVSVVPLRFVLHRGSVLLTVGLIALGAARTTEDDPVPTPLLVGLGGWVMALFLPLFGYL